MSNVSKRDFFERACENVQFVKNIVTGDDSWVYVLETKQQPSQWKGPTSPRPKKGRHVRSKTKVILLAFFYYFEGIVHHEYAPDGQTIVVPSYLPSSFPGKDTKTYGRISPPPAKEIWQI